MRSIFFFLLGIVFAAAFKIREWPDSCTQHAGAIKATSKDHNPYSEDGRRCLLTFRFYGTKEDATEYCKEVHHDVFVKHDIDSDAHELTCHYERHFSCEENQVLVNGFCFFLPSSQTVTLNEAEKQCQAEKGQLPSAFESANLKIIRDYWLSPLDPRVRSVWLDSKISISRTKSAAGRAMVFRFRPDLERLGDPLDLEEVDASTKRHVLCYKAARPQRLALKVYCDQLKALGIMANYYRGVCFTKSANWGFMDKEIPNESDKGLDKEYVEPLHKQCSWMGRVAQAVGPWSETFYKGMEGLLTTYNKQKQMILIPGIEMEYTDGMSNKKQSPGFMFFTANGKEMASHNGQFWNQEQMLEKFKVLPEKRLSLLFNDFEYSSLHPFRVTSVPVYVRAPLICGLGISDADQTQSVCDKDFVLNYREDGTAICHTMVSDGQRRTYDGWKKECEKLGAKPGSFDNYQEMLSVYEHFEKDIGKLFFYWVGARCGLSDSSKDTCKPNDLEWEDEVRPVWFVNFPRTYFLMEEIFHSKSDCIALMGESGAFENKKCEQQSAKGIVCTKRPSIL